MSVARKLGFSVGDELGLPESIGNLEGNKRRSLSDRDSAAAANSIGTLPASKLPVSASVYRMCCIAIIGLMNAINWFYFYTTQPYQSQPIQQNRPIAVLSAMPQPQYGNHQPQSSSVTTSTTSTNYKQSVAIAMTPESAVPAFKRIPTSSSSPASLDAAPSRPILNAAAQNTFQRKAAAVYPSGAMSQLNNLTFTPGQPFRTSTVIQKIQNKPQQSMLSSVPAFQAMPSSVARISSGQVLQMDTTKTTVKTVKREVCSLAECRF